MLEHAIPEGPVAPTPPEEPAADYYTPKQAAAPLTGKDTAASVKRFNRKMVATLGVIGTMVIGAAFTVGLQKPKPKAPESAAALQRPPAPAADVDALPDAYSDIPVLGDPRPGDVGAMAGTTRTTGTGGRREITPLEQYAESAELERLRNEDRARTATVSFVTAGSGESISPAGAASLTDSGSGLEGRLLNLAEHPASSVTSTQSASGHDDANRQDEKNEFLEHPHGTDFTLHETLEHPRSPYTLFAGTILPCVLTQGIDSDLPGQIGCMISQNVYDTVTGRYLLLPQGTKAIGTYDSRVAYGQERVLVVWTRLLRPDGSTLSLDGMPGVDLSGYAGLNGHVDNHYLRLLSGVVLGSIIGAGAQIAVGANTQNPSFAALAVQGAGQNINEAGQQITRKNLSIQPTIEVRPGARLNIVATRDLILPPWQ